MNAEEDKLPEMSDAVLDDDQLAALFRDLRQCVEVDEIVLRTGPGRADDAGQATLDDAESLLAEREVRGVQVRYRYDGANWMDTLMPVADGVRLVRIRHDTPT
jgi:hypothetical protein